MSPALAGWCRVVLLCGCRDGGWQRVDALIAMNGVLLKLGRRPLGPLIPALCLEVRSFHLKSSVICLNYRTRENWICENFSDLFFTFKEEMFWFKNLDKSTLQVYYEIYGILHLSDIFSWLQTSIWFQKPVKLDVFFLMCVVGASDHDAEPDEGEADGHADRLVQRVSQILWLLLRTGFSGTHSGVRKTYKDTQND